MRRCLVVGCGGSGGATAAYLMDQLRSDLAAHGVTDLPGGWQFLHLDVPRSGEPGPDGLGNVGQQGGTYFGSSPKEAGYAVLDDAVSQRFADENALDVLATWAPRDPEEIASPITEGAGQYRAVGRLITLNRAALLRSALVTAWEQLHRVDTATEMGALRVPGLGDYDDGTPLVIVVSSMAGGAGASMALDVCQLLTLVPGVDPQLIGVFMVAPTIFDSLPEAARGGVRPNALAMFGEIIAGQTGAARSHDLRALQGLGMHGGDGAKVPFVRVFPVGSHSGVDRTRFGDGSPHAVYRGLGRGLAGLLMSGTATKQFIAYDLTNPDPPGDRDVLGWGAEWGPLAWGSYGFASLSMGRDRYAEYAAQRIADSAVERLLHEHRGPGDDRGSAVQQVRALVDSQWAEACGAAGLPLVADRSPVDAGPRLTDWMVQIAFPRRRVAEAVAAIVERDVRPAVPDPTGLRVGAWEQVLRAQLGDRRAAMRAAVDDAATTMAFEWHEERSRAVEAVAVDAVRRLGLAYAAALVERLAAHVRESVAPGVDRLAAQPVGDVAGVPVAALAEFAALGGGQVQNGRPLVDRVLAGLDDQLGTAIYTRLADLTRQLLLDYAEDVLGPLRGALRQAQRTLEQAVAAPVVDLGRAVLATVHPPAWPSDRDVQVPSRFDHADNEVLLTSSVHFPQQYTADVRRAAATAGTATFAEARARMVADVVAGTWSTTGGARPPGGLLERLAPWRSGVFTVDPRTGDPLVPSRARFDVHVRPPELLARARLYVARPGEAFHDFCRLSIRDFVRGAGAAESELADRRREIVAKFVEALKLAQPLVSVSGTVLQKVHPGVQLGYRYKFSEVPFVGLPVADDLKRVMQGNDGMLDPSSLVNFTAALGDSAGTTRIDVFGSYRNFSPIVFDAVLPPAAEQWARAGDLGREPFWQWRRSRPLDAALPMGDHERRAMVTGWLIGQMVGRIRTPPSPYVDPVQIWDDEAGRWLAFPHPLLTPPSRFLARYDWMPAVLESVLLAMARSHQPPVLASLRPYQVLRGLSDTTSQAPREGIIERSAEGLIAGWLGGRAPAGGGRSRVPGADTADGPEALKEAAIAWLGEIQDLAGGQPTTPRRDGAPGGGRHSVVASRRAAAKVPIFQDLAPDTYHATLDIIELIKRSTPHDPDSDAPPPVRDVEF